MRFKLAALAAAIAVVALAPATANAASYVITYTGKITGVYNDIYDSEGLFIETTYVPAHDESGQFGLGNQSLDGQSFTANYVLTIPTPGATAASGVNNFSYYGNGLSAPLSGNLTINGITKSFSGGFAQFGVGDNAVGLSLDYIETNISRFFRDGQNYTSIGLINSLSSSQIDFFNLGDFLQSSNYQLSVNAINQSQYNSGFGQGYFYIQSGTISDGSSTQLSDSRGNFVTESVTVTQITSSSGTGGTETGGGTGAGGETGTGGGTGGGSGTGGGTVVTVPGGTREDPAPLGTSNPVSSITDTIAETGPTEKFFSFMWDGQNVLESTFSVVFESGLQSNESLYTIQLFDANGVVVPLFDTSNNDVFDGVLNVQNDFMRSFRAGGNLANGYTCNFANSPCNLAAGNYTIGLFGNTSIDPELTISFASPVYAVTRGAVPEPATWAMLIVGLGFVGGSMRRRRSHAAIA